MNNNEYRLMPVALLPAIRDALVETGKCFQPETLWAAIIEAHDRVSVVAPAGSFEDAVARYEYMAALWLKANKRVRELEAAAPERSETPADEQPKAWAVFAPDGNCRIWFGDIEAARRWKARYEPTLSSELTPLYTRPAPTVCSSFDITEEQARVALGKLSPDELANLVQGGSSAAPSDPYAAITLGNLKAGKLTAARVYVAYCELRGELDAANGAIERYKALATPSVQPVAAAGQEWISVKDRLPEGDVDVIVLFWPYDNHANKQVAGTAHFHDGGFFTEDGDDHHSPSHWMPLNRPADVIAANTPALPGEGK